MQRSDSIFIHAWWRSGSTYLWSKLRENASNHCYYEPLHEKISTLTIAAINASPEIEISKALRHRIEARSYFYEYAELIRSGRLRYSTELAYDLYFLQPGQKDNALHAYLDGLISAAAAVERRGVLCFCRSQMRSAWMKDVFGGIHVGQIRNPADQWSSFNIEPYFTNKVITIALSLRKTHPRAFVHIEPFERFAHDLSKRPSFDAEMLSKFFIKQKDALAVFLVIWIASALQVISHCDFVVDIDQLSTDPDYRNKASEWFASIGCSIDFSDCAIPQTAEAQDSLVDDAVNAIRSNAASLVIAEPNAIRKWLPLLSPLSRRILSDALEG